MGKLPLPWLRARIEQQLRRCSHSPAAEACLHHDWERSFSPENRCKPAVKGKALGGKRAYGKIMVFFSGIIACLR
ncbi:MAG: hypothetical protein C4554_00380 [Dethiobacter sp.]|nr:MAG: hypothetical protein C4554_00380 [Dethiobacter sp.]